MFGTGQKVGYSNFNWLAPNFKSGGSIFLHRLEIASTLVFQKWAGVFVCPLIEGFIIAKIRKKFSFSFFPFMKNNFLAKNSAKGTV